jgi:fucose permease
MSDVVPAPLPVRAGRAMTVLCAVFFSGGFLMAAIGPVQPALAARTGVTLAELKWLMPAIFAGSIGSQFIVGPLRDRLGRRRVLTVALLVLAGTGLAIALTWWLWLLLLAAFLYGVGYGSFSLSGNVMSSELVPERRASAVNLVNLFFGLGAFVGPLVISLLLRRAGVSLPALWIGAALLVGSAIAASLTLPDLLPAVRREAATAPAGRAASLADPVVFACGVFLLLYVGSEMAASAWASEYLQRSAGMTAAAAALAVSIFWATLTAGRMSAVLAGMRVTADHLLTTAVCVACAGSALLWAAHGSPRLSVVAYAIMGFGYGPIYPTGVAVLTKRYPHAAGTATSQMGILAAMGGMILPWLHGLVLAQRSSVYSAVLTLGVSLATIAAWEWMRRLARKPA